MNMLQRPPLNEGEIYVGFIGDASGDGYHVVLLPGDNDDAPFKQQLDWAKSIGGDLPTRVEQAMLWASFKDKFKKDYYWSNETHEGNPSCAWDQTFIDGSQNYDPKYYGLRARAVRRLPIQ